MKAAFRFCKPEPTFDNFAAMIVINFEGVSKNVYIELKSCI